MVIKPALRIAGRTSHRRPSKPLRWLALSAIAVSAIVVGGVLLPTTSMAASAPAVMPPSATLTAQWWQTYVSIQNPTDRCDLGIDQVVFLNGNGPSPASRSCTLAAGTTILVPLINVECSSLDDPPFLATTTAARRQCAKGFADQFTDPVLRISPPPDLLANALSLSPEWSKPTSTNPSMRGRNSSRVSLSPGP